VILRALVTTLEIICAPFLDLGRPTPAGFDEREFIIDPRGIQFKVYPMSEALAWIGGQTLEHSYRLMEVCTNPDGSILIPESVRSEKHWLLWDISPRGEGRPPLLRRGYRVVKSWPYG
jgi:hypothetical protein